VINKVKLYHELYIFDGLQNFTEPTCAHSEPTVKFSEFLEQYAGSKELIILKLTLSRLNHNFIFTAILESKNFQQLNHIILSTF
jgi:leucyl-tRNA synthetase